MSVVKITTTPRGISRGVAIAFLAPRVTGSHGWTINEGGMSATCTNCKKRVVLRKSRRLLPWGTVWDPLKQSPDFTSPCYDSWTIIRLPQSRWITDRCGSCEEPTGYSDEPGVCARCKILRRLNDLDDGEYVYSLQGRGAHDPPGWVGPVIL